MAKAKSALKKIEDAADNELLSALGVKKLIVKLPHMELGFLKEEYGFLTDFQIAQQGGETFVTATPSATMTAADFRRLQKDKRVNEVVTPSARGSHIERRNENDTGRW